MAACCLAVRARRAPLAARGPAGALPGRIGDRGSPAAGGGSPTAQPWPWPSWRWPRGGLAGVAGGRGGGGRGRGRRPVRACRSGAGPRRWPGPAGCARWPGGGGARGRRGGARRGRPGSPRRGGRGRPGGARPGRPGLPGHRAGGASACRTHFVDAAAARLPAGAPTVVAVTGSYGKTSTKDHIAHLVARSRTVVATPASFNNRAGLARAVNEHLADGTEVFVAEMGTYGPGEIAELCRWCPPDIAVITAIGPVHLERFGSEERIVEAKAEILVAGGRRGADRGRRPPGRAGGPGRSRGQAGPAVLGARPGGRRVRAAVSADGATVGCPSTGAGRLAEDAAVPAGRPAHQPGLRRRPSPRCSASTGRPSRSRLARPAHRSSTGCRGPARRPGPPSSTTPTTPIRPGQPRPLAVLVAGAGNRTRRPVRCARRVVVTPGMVELGPRQVEENRRVRRRGRRGGHRPVVVGRTNRRALMAGAASAPGRGVTVHPVRPPRPGGGVGPRAPRPGRRRCCTRTICRTTTLEKPSLPARPGRTPPRRHPPPIGGVASP